MAAKTIGGAALLLVLSCAACLNNPPINPAELNFTWRRPAESDLVGTWVPTKDTLDDIRTRGGYATTNHELVLRQDGTLSLSNMPDWWIDDSGESRHALDSGSGTWRLVKDGSWQVDLTLNAFRGSSSFGVRLNLRRQRPPYLIHIFVGDPDEWHAMLFERSDRQ